ncbi:4,5-DOPA dioxygenase extradiol [soil metagenome]
MAQAKPSRMPAIFFGHGSPMNAIEENVYTKAWRTLGKAIPRPKAILAVSAHWTTSLGTAVTAMPMPETIHDFGGFPKALFDIRYPAAGDPALAARVGELLAPLNVQMDHSWGIDHGTWSVLVKLFPLADIPVVQLSIDLDQDNEFHFDLGRRLASLRDEGVLIIGSGNVVHNLRAVDWRKGPPYEWATRFNNRIREDMLRGEFEHVVQYEMHGEDALMSVPTSEHYLPLLYVLGSMRQDEAVTVAVDGIELASVSMLTVVVGPKVVPKQ